MTTLHVIWLSVGVGVVSLILVAWLKGAFQIAFRLLRELTQRFSHEGGEPWTIAVAAEPFVAPFAAFFAAAFGVAHPASRWARWFYGERRMAEARARYPHDTSPAVPTD
ncbi:MAG: hypothetical protein QNJ88_08295 [Acidimicrobiia bacterium]|nr:hypothetical protein [Acidimicrobiia bacterium]